MTHTLRSTSAFGEIIDLRLARTRPTMTNNLSELDQARWLRVKDRLRAEVGEDIFSSWFARMELEGIEVDTVHLTVPTRFLRSWIQSHYAERVLACWQAEDHSRVPHRSVGALGRHPSGHHCARQSRRNRCAKARDRKPEGRELRGVAAPVSAAARGARRLAARRAADIFKLLWSAVPTRLRMPPPNRSQPPRAATR